MKLVHPLDILGTPEPVPASRFQVAGGETVYRELPCPDGDGNARVYADGSLLCLTSGQWYAPESDDSELFAMRRDFDRTNGISPADRLLIPARVKFGQGLVATS